MLSVANQSRRFSRLEALNRAPDVLHAEVLKSLRNFSVSILIGLRAMSGGTDNSSLHSRALTALRVEVAAQNAARHFRDAWSTSAHEHKPQGVPLAR